MNKHATNIIFFTSGIVVGAGSMYFGLKKFFELKADKEICEVRAAYDKRMEDIEPKKSSLDGDIIGPNVIEDAEPGVSETKSSIVRELNNKPPLIDYAKMFREKDEHIISRDPSEDMIERELAESEFPKDDEEMSDEEDADAQADYETYKLNADHKKAIEENREPFIIGPDDFELTCSHYAKMSLHYYLQDDIVTTDDDELINVPDILGDCLETSGFSNNEDDILYVRNDVLMADYEIDKIFSQFTGE